MRKASPGNWTMGLRDPEEMARTALGREIADA
jgi:hypothetical protein